MYTKIMNERVKVSGGIRAICREAHKEHLAQQQSIEKEMTMFLRGARVGQTVLHSVRV